MGHFLGGVTDLLGNIVGGADPLRDHFVLQLLDFPPGKFPLAETIAHFDARLVGAYAGYFFVERDPYKSDPEQKDDGGGYMGEPWFPKELRIAIGQEREEERHGGHDQRGDDLAASISQLNDVVQGDIHRQRIILWPDLRG